MGPKLGFARTVEEQRAATARRQRDRRARRRQGEAVYHLVLPEYAVVNAMIASGQMLEDATRRKSLVEQALVSVVVAWTKRWKD